jgi:SAM-dependent methyltransferase
MPIDCFKQKAVQGGLDNGCDVKAIKKYIKNAKSILEVGAGYGRVLNHIIKNGFKGKLFALEREQKLCRFLEKQFLQAHIIRADIRQFIIKQKFDLILWMWASLTEFSQAEQLLALKNLTLHLKIGGFLILDLISINCKTIDAINYDGHNKIITTAYGNDFIYLPSHDEIKLYAQKLNLLKKEIIIYKTKTNKKRNLYVLQKN